MITNKGLNSIAKAYKEIPAYMVVGSSDTTITSGTDILPGEFERLSIDSTEVVDNTVKFYGSRSGVTANDDLISGFGLTLSDTLGTSDLEVGNLISSLVHSTDFDIECEFWFTFERAR